ncbi:hypothetical protein BDZ91DRAFT_710318 [Kalaharituber pfeilii]|nr:hypothetical protein BDZ91DRAFT_710318 [Kalaharituber pfeilii]
MAARFLSSLIVILVHVVPLTVSQLTCPASDAAPFSMDIKKWRIDLAPKPPTLIVSFGPDDSQQFIPVLASLRFNETYVVRDGSVDRVGFNPSESPSWEPLGDSNSTESSELSDPGIFGNDTMHVIGRNLTNSISVDDFPTYVMSSYDNKKQAVGPNSLGLASKSASVLHYLWKAGKIPGRGYGIQTGLFVPDDDSRIAGELILGGFNKKRMEGDAYEYDILRENMIPGRGSLVVKVVGLELDWDGTGANVTDLLEVDGTRTEGFKAMLEARLPYLEFPTAIADNFQRATQASHSNTFLKPSANFTGHMKVTLDTGLEVTLPSALLTQSFGNNFSPVRLKQGFSDMSKQGLDFPLLGAHFLSELYLYVDFEQENSKRAGIFGLAKIARNSDSEIIPFCSSEDPKNSDQSNDDGNGDDSAGENPGGNDDGAQSTNSSKVGKDAIAGIAVGSAFVVISCIGGFIWWLRRRPPAPLALIPPVEADSNEVPAQQQYPAELEGHRGVMIAGKSSDATLGSGNVQQEYYNVNVAPAQPQVHVQQSQ